MEKSIWKYLVENLENAKVQSPEAEAKIIGEKVLNKGMFELQTNILETLNDSLIDELKYIFQRRKHHEPIQYIFNNAFFYELDFEVTKDVLIPRAETEIMVEKIIDELPFYGNFLDIGCGSGAIAISVTNSRKDATTYAVDISSKALNLAQKNALNHKIRSIKFIESDLFSKIDKSLKFDIIGANLPYVTFDEYEKCPLEVKLFEPQLALTADDNGLAIIKNCAVQALNFLKPKGKIFFEIGYMQAEELTKFLLSQGYKNVKTICDYNGLNRFVKAEK